jgi:hypothetical protein
MPRTAKSDGQDTQDTTNGDTVTTTSEWDEIAWTPVVQDDGEKLTLRPGTPFRGTLVGMKSIDRANPETGEVEQATLCIFDSADGGRYNMWANYALRQALDKGLSIGDRVMIVYDGKSDIGRGRTMNRMSVFRA